MREVLPTKHFNDAHQGAGCLAPGRADKGTLKYSVTIPQREHSYCTFILPYSSVTNTHPFLPAIDFFHNAALRKLHYASGNALFRKLCAVSAALRPLYARCSFIGIFAHKSYVHHLESFKIRISYQIKFPSTQHYALHLPGNIILHYAVRTPLKKDI